VSRAAQGFGTDASGWIGKSNKEKRSGKQLSKEQADCYLQAKDPKSAANDHFNDKLEAVKKPRRLLGKYEDNCRNKSGRMGIFGR